MDKKKFDNIECRPFNVKFHVKRPDGTQKEISIDSLPRAERIEVEMAVIELMDKKVLEDDLREAKAVLKHIMEIK